MSLLRRDSAGAEWGATAWSGGAAAGRLQRAAGQGQRQGSRSGQGASQGNKWKIIVVQHTDKKEN
jgi:hypothetical protein